MSLSLNMGVKMLSPLGLEIVNRTIGAKRRGKIWLTFVLSMTKWNWTFLKHGCKNSVPRHKTMAKILSQNFRQNIPKVNFSWAEFFPPRYVYANVHIQSKICASGESVFDPTQTQIFYPPHSKRIKFFFGGGRRQPPSHRYRHFDLFIRPQCVNVAICSYITKYDCSKALY